MKRNKPEISPEEIRAIRENLGLSQVEAGELIGGGPRAFTKYEAGTVKPAASIINLLRLLEANPAAIATLGGKAPQPINASVVGPFEVASDNITVFRERNLPVLFAETAERRSASKRSSRSPYLCCQQHPCPRWRGRRTDHVDGRP